MPTFHGDDKKHVHEFAKDAEITVDGKPAKLDELKEGFPVKVILNDKFVISLLDAKSKKKLEVSFRWMSGHAESS